MCGKMGGRESVKQLDSGHGLTLSLENLVIFSMVEIEMAVPYV